MLYWKEEKSDIDYLLTDYLIRWAYDNIESVKDDIDILPVNNVNRGKLLPILNDEFNEIMED